MMSIYADSIKHFFFTFFDPFDFDSFTDPFIYIYLSSWSWEKKTYWRIDRTKDTKNGHATLHTSYVKSCPLTSSRVLWGTIKKIKNIVLVFTPIKGQCCPHIENSHLTWFAIQLTVFYMRATLTLINLIE